jgi:hypothetical protein
MFQNNLIQEHDVKQTNKLLELEREVQRLMNIIAQMTIKQVEAKQ